MLLIYLVITRVENLKNSYIEVWDAPGLGISFNGKAEKYLKEEDKDFFD